MTTLELGKVNIAGLHRSYIAALSIVAVLSLLAHAAMAITLRSNEDSAEIINESGRQRMLSQQIALFSLRHLNGDVQFRASLNAAIDRFESSHDRLLALADAEQFSDTASIRLQDTYYGSSQVDDISIAYIAAARQVADWAPGETVPQASVQFISGNRETLLSGLDQVVSIHQQNAESRTDMLEHAQWAILSIVLITLFCEGFFIFRPMAFRLRTYVRQLLKLADRDHLTGLYNRRALNELADAQIDYARRHDGKVALLALDIDHFKSVNDTFGHATGDLVLTTIAHQLRGLAREHDIVGRIGGEEFIMMLPSASMHEAGKVAERVREAIAQEPVDANGTLLPVTVSIGIASVNLNAEPAFETAVKAADRMLYKAKQSGRNRVWPQLAGPIDAARDAGATGAIPLPN